MVSSLVWLSCCLAWLSGPDVVVVSTPELRPALRSWIDYRESQGHRIMWIAGDADPRVVRERIIAQARRSFVRNILLVGDHTGPHALPTFHIPARVNIHFRSEPLIASDAPYGDLDGDRSPDVAVGRWSVETPQEIAWQLEKIRVFEGTGGAWRHQLHLVAGSGGFGRVIDGAIEMAAKRLLARGIPPGYHMTTTRASWQSPFCPAPADFRQCVIDRLNEGGLFWIYMGHGHWSELDRLTVPGKRFPILQANDASRLSYRQAPSIAVFLACYTGAIDAEESLAELFVRARGGPVAAIAASRVSMPFGMTVFGTGLMDGYFDDRAATLGDIYLSAQQRLTAERLPARDRWLEWIAKGISPKPELLAAEKQEHVWLFNLLGDPLLRLPQPERASMAVAERVTADEPLTVSVTVPFGGEGVLTLLNPPSTPRESFAARTELPIDRTAELKLTREYHQANDAVWLSRPVTFSRAGTYKLAPAFRVPSSARGPCRLCLFIEHEDGRYAMAAKAVVVAPPLDSGEVPARPRSD